MRSQATAQQGGQHTLADAAHAHERYQATALLHDPLRELGHFHLAAREPAGVQGFCPVDAWEGRRLRSRVGNRRGDLWEQRDGPRRSEQGSQPGVIQQHLLVRRLPERADLLLLAPGGKGLLLHPQFDELFEALGFGVAEAGLPLRHGAPGDAQPLTQPRLRQADGGAQCQHHLAEGIVSLTVRVSLHGRSPFCVTRRSEILCSDVK